MTVVGLATGVDEALELIEELQPDLLVVENGEGDSSWLVEARRLSPGLKTVVLSSVDDPAQIDAAFAAGATAYIVKTASPDDIEVALRQTFGPSLFLARDQEAGRAPVTPNGPSVALTERQAQILELVADGRSNNEVARALWVTEQTVKFHLSNIYRKLGVANRTEASRWAQVNGLLAADSDSSANRA